MNRFLLAGVLCWLSQGMAFAGPPFEPAVPIELEERQVARTKEFERDATQSPAAAYQLAALLTEQSNHLCGTGHQIELQQRTFALWLAMASPTTTDAQLDAMWRILVSGQISLSGPQLFLIYQKAGIHRIAGDLQRAEKLIGDPEDATHQRQRESLDWIGRSLKGYVEAFKTYRTGKIAELIAQHSHGVDEGLHGNLDTLVINSSAAPDYKWEPRVLVESLVQRKDESLEPLLKVVAENESVRPTTLAALGKIGGERAIESLKGLALRQTNVWDLRDTYYALLLCDDGKVVTYLQDPVHTAHTPNAAIAAAWALTSQGHDATAYDSSAEE